MPWYHYMLCPGTTIVLCPGTTMCYALVPLTMCYVPLPLCVTSWSHCVYFHWSEIARPFFFTFKPVNLQASPHKPISMQKVLYMQSLLTPTEHWLASPGTSATFRAGPWSHLKAHMSLVSSKCIHSPAHHLGWCVVEIIGSQIYTCICVLSIA